MTRHVPLGHRSTAPSQQEVEEPEGTLPAVRRSLGFFACGSMIVNDWASTVLRPPTTLWQPRLGLLAERQVQGWGRRELLVPRPQVDLFFELAMTSRALVQTLRDRSVLRLDDVATVRLRLRLSDEQTSHTALAGRTRCLA